MELNDLIDRTGKALAKCKVRSMGMKSKGNVGKSGYRTKGFKVNLKLKDKPYYQETICLSKNTKHRYIQ